jgi:1-acyl-sn-glycerol-3-phosphate acyltransferase
MFRSIFFALVLIIETVICTFLAMIGGLFNPYSLFNTRIMRLWARVILILAGIKLEVCGKENLSKKTSYIVVGNHQSHMDIPVVTVALPIPLRIISKKELFKIPVFGWGMKAMGIISIDRFNQKKSIESLRQAEQVILKYHMSILAFPEGTRSPDGKIHPFKKGPFVLAINTGIPILPVSVCGTRHILPKGKIRINSGRVKVIIHPPILTEGSKMEKRHVLGDTTYRVIEQNFIENYR